MSAQRTGHDLVGFGLRVLVQVALFRVLEPTVRALGRLPAAAYEGRVFLDAVPLRIYELVRSHPAAAAAGLVGLVACALVPRLRADTARLFDGWRSVEDGPAVRALVGVLTAVPTWAWSTYATNAWFGQAHVLDRLMLVGLWALALWRPLFLLPWAVALAAVLSQFDLPLAQFSWTEADLLVRIPILVTAYWVVRAFGRERGAHTLVFLLCCLLATTYWWSGVGKLRIDWLAHPHIHLLIFGAYANGWLSFLEPATIARISATLAPFTVPLMLFTLLVELGALLLLARRSFLQGFLVLALVFHTGVFLFSGICFWKWMAVEVALLVFLRTGDRIERLPFFTPAHAVLSILLIGGATLWVRPGNLTWYDTPLTYSLRLEGVTTTGRTVPLDAGSFAPYREMFVLGLFPYLSPDVQLTGTMGAATDPARADALVRAPTVETVRALEAAVGAGRYDAAQAQAFEALVARYARRLNARGPDRFGITDLLRAPPHLWSSPRSPRWEGQSPLQHVRVIESTRLFDGVLPHEIRRRVLAVVEVGAR
ncbi:MAG: hypothetical protein R3E98_08995 [Gemmatimonadota bacterium]